MDSLGKEDNLAIHPHKLLLCLCMLNLNYMLSQHTDTDVRNHTMSLLISNNGFIMYKTT
jgi:hypothetical protein